MYSRVCGIPRRQCSDMYMYTCMYAVMLYPNRVRVGICLTSAALSGDMNNRSTYCIHIHVDL
jgi:hypothetical protein